MAFMQSSQSAFDAKTPFQTFGMHRLPLSRMPSVAAAVYLSCGAEPDRYASTLAMIPDDTLQGTSAATTGEWFPPLHDVVRLISPVIDRRFLDPGTRAP